MLNRCHCEDNHLHVFVGSGHCTCLFIRHSALRIVFIWCSWMGIISLHTITHKKRSNMTEVFWHHYNPQYYYQKFLLAIIFPNIETYISFGH